MSLGILARLERFAASSTGTVFERSHAAAWASQILSVSRFTQIQHRSDPASPINVLAVSPAPPSCSSSPSFHAQDALTDKVSRSRRAFWIPVRGITGVDLDSILRHTFSDITNPSFIFRDTNAPFADPRATLQPSLMRRCRRIGRRSASNMSSAASACRPTRLLFTRLRAAVDSSPPYPDFAACPLTFASNLGGGVAVSLQPSPTHRPLLRPLLSLSLVCPISTAVRMQNRSFCRFCTRPSPRVPPSSRVLVFLRSRFMAAGIFLRPLGLMDDACASFQRCSSCHMLVQPHCCTYGSKYSKRFAAAAYYTFAHLRRDRVIVHFIDSQVAFAWVAKGYASQLHVADIVNQLHLDHLHGQVRFEWLDSDANIADIPSGGDPEDPALAGDYAMREPGATRITAKLPPIPPSYYATAATP
ncbi:hypothetical protein RI054_01g00040 [Pseudoscourfieldia marina]